MSLCQFLLKWTGWCVSILIFQKVVDPVLDIEVRILYKTPVCSMLGFLFPKEPLSLALLLIYYQLTCIYEVSYLSACSKANDLGFLLLETHLDWSMVFCFCFKVKQQLIICLINVALSRLALLLQFCCRHHRNDQNNVNVENNVSDLAKKIPFNLFCYNTLQNITQFPGLGYEKNNSHTKHL